LRRRDLQYADRSAGNIEADGLLLKQALTNLLENGVNAMAGAPGTIDVTLSVTDDQVTIAVADSGCGIDESETDRIFTPFYSTRPSGSGLGLPLVRKIVDLHGGELTFDSREGHGATFTVTLPLHQAASASQTAAAVVSAARRDRGGPDRPASA
jgi:two-component system sensor histidine kinase AtoS